MQLIFLVLIGLIFNMVYAQSTNTVDLPLDSVVKSDFPWDLSLSFTSAFTSSFSMVLISEIGDKTFFIAAIMAMSNPRGIIIASALSALALMTILSVAIGVALPALISKDLTHLASCILFVVFGVKLLVDAYVDDEGGVLEEMQEVEEELEVHNASHGSDSDVSENDIEAQTLKGSQMKTNKRNLYDINPKQSCLSHIFSPVFLQCFTMTFLAEWGDRSQVTTIIMSAVKNPLGVCVGGILGHSICTTVAAFCGKMIAHRISERVVNIIGGCLFMTFAISGFMFGA